MGLKQKVIAAMREKLGAETVDLSKGSDIYGKVVSSRFYGMSVKERLDAMYAALEDPQYDLTQLQIRKIRLLMAMTPQEVAAHRWMDGDSNGKPKKKRATRRAKV